GLYPRLEQSLSIPARLLPFPVVDLLSLLLIVALPLWWIRTIRKTEARRRWSRVGSLAANTIVLAALLFIAFQILWGWNYQRRPITAKLDWDSRRVERPAYLELARTTCLRLNIEVPAAHSRPWNGEDGQTKSLHRSVEEISRIIGAARGFTA